MEGRNRQAEEPEPSRWIHVPLEEKAVGVREKGGLFSAAESAIPPFFKL